MQSSQFVIDATSSNHDQAYSFTFTPARQIASRSQSNDAYAWTAHAVVNRSYAANGLNQYSAVTTGGQTSTFQHDGNGNLTSDGSAAFVYDVENRLVSAPGATLRYDPLGRLYEVADIYGAVRFLYDGDALIGEYKATGRLLRRYLHGIESGDDPLVWFEGTGVATAAMRHLISDERGSVVGVTDATGNMLIVNSYDEYGIPAPTNLGRFQYTGQAWIPEIGLYHYKARVYSPTLGRFLQTDPVGYDDGPHLYAYVGNDPVNGRDPTGMYDCKGESACDAAARGRAQMIQARDNHARNSRDMRVTLAQRHASGAAARIIDTGLTALGTHNDDNGLNIETASLNERYDAQRLTLADYNSANTTIRLDTRALEIRPQFSIGAVLGHEVVHHRLRGAGLDGMSAEARPLILEFLVERGLGGLRDQSQSQWVQENLIPYCGPRGPICIAGAESVYRRQSTVPF